MKGKFGVGIVAGVTATLLAVTPLAANEGGVLKAELRGANEVPPVTTATTGSVIAKLSPDGSQLALRMTFRDAQGMLGAGGAHLHCAPEGTNGGVVIFVAGATPGGYSGTYVLDVTLTQANVVNTSTVCGSTLADIVAAAQAGMVYVNAHSATNPAGEVRGQLRG